MEIIKNKEFEFEKDDYLWKYFDLHKFLYFIVNAKLVFARLDKLEDPLEGLSNKILSELSNLEMIPETKNDLNDSFTEVEKENIISNRKSTQIRINEQIDLYQKLQFANCWFVGKKESFAMWNIYSNKDSVAIRYKPEDLLKIVLPSARNYIDKDFQEFIYGFVDYDDIWPFDHYKQGRTNITYTAFKKDKSYVHENEFRFLVVIPDDCINKYDSFQLPLGDITKDDFWIFVNPYMDQWKFENLKLILEKYALNKKMHKSSLKIKNNF